MKSSIVLTLRSGNVAALPTELRQHRRGILDGANTINSLSHIRHDELRTPHRPADGRRWKQAVPGIYLHAQGAQHTADRDLIAFDQGFDFIETFGGEAAPHIAGSALEAFQLP